MKKEKPSNLNEGVIVCTDALTYIQLAPGTRYAVALTGYPVFASAYIISWVFKDFVVAYSENDAAATAQMFELVTPPGGLICVTLTDAVGDETMEFSYHKIAL